MISLKHGLKWLLLCALPLSALAQSAQIDIPFQKFVLDNGLRLIVHEDHKAPLVAVSVWYNVGSKDEPEGKTGFAHLFEHLMFNGSENYNDEYFEPFHRVGATDMNGTTWLDRTNYFETVPTPALDMALWMESDRMGHLLGVIDQARLDEQRGVVQNEKRQGDNQPYGKARYRINEGLYPVGHPYRHSTIGSMDDLNAASLQDVKDWFNKYYGAANAVLVLAGDITPEQALAKVKKYFGDIEAGPALNRINRWVPTRDHDSAEQMFDQVPQARIYRNWSVPGRNEKASALLSLAAAILGQGKNSRLYQALVYQNQWASEAEAYMNPHLLDSKFQMEITVKQGVDEKKVEREMLRVMDTFLQQPPSADELQRARAGILSKTIRGLEKVGGFRGKAVTLAKGELYANDAAFYKKYLGWIENATAADVQQAAQQWLAKGAYQLTVLPEGKHKVAKSSVDRSKGLPAVGDMPDLKLPKLQRARLDNGIEIVLAATHTVPVVNIAMQFDAGFAADSSGFKPGTAAYTLSMLDEGTKTKNALQISAELEKLGAKLNTESTLDTSSVTLSALKSNLAPSLALFSDVILNPAFSDEEIERLRGQWLAKIKLEKSRPRQLAFRLLPAVLYGKGHAYGIPFTGSGTAAGIKSLTRQDLQKFYQSWLRADNATLLITGDTTLEAIQPLLNRSFGQWKKPALKMPQKNIRKVGDQAQKLIIIDKPGAEQSLILAGELAPGSGSPDNIAIEGMNDILGGSFTARINMNLREDKHWAYGAFSFLKEARGQRPFMLYAPVQTDKTGASIAELQKEVTQFIGDKPATAAELKKMVQNNVNKLPGAYETSRDVLEGLQQNRRFNRPDDYIPRLVSQYRGLTLAQIQQQAKKIVRPKNLVWMVVGDKKKILPQLNKLELGERLMMDLDGNVLDQP